MRVLLVHTWVMCMPSDCGCKKMESDLLQLEFFMVMNVRNPVLYKSNDFF